MRLPLLALVLTVITLPLHAEPARVTVVTNDGRHGGTLSVATVEVQSGQRVAKVPLVEITSIHFGDTDVVRTRRDQRVKGVVRVEGWSLKEAEKEKPLSRADLKFVVP